MKSQAGTRIRGMGCHTAAPSSHVATPVPARLANAHPASLAALQSTLYNAIARIVLAQPHLHVGIVGETSKHPGFVRLERLDLRNHVQWKIVDDSGQREDVYREAMQTQLDSRFEHLSTRPGWRVVVVYEPVAEIMAVVIPCKVFFQNEDHGILHLPDPSAKLPPNPERLTSWPATPTFLLKTVWHLSKPLWIFPPSNHHAIWAPIQPAPFATQFRRFSLPNAVLENVVIRCRERNTTLTGLVHALVLVSLSCTLGNSNAKAFASRTPYDLRKVLPERSKEYPWLETKEAMCNYVSVLDHEFDAELVARIRNQKTTNKLPGPAVETRNNESGQLGPPVSRVNGYNMVRRVPGPSGDQSET
ncbi:hypothetical protein BCR34DRAFT_602069 [Clohesyomyces aquaticus]|uniref:Uncharacterized protein n=1 Tax=Clohesyomyces aquaticus TaxID=1231657 RepID=A0A1Y1ZJW8_9PLEO|nr:hypothetical protein BCR34DRAFT_602069 [Clohesyomyces aquaticus]